jgi:hypothetical protein
MLRRPCGFWTRSKPIESLTAESDFAPEFLQTGIVVKHDPEGHVFHFPILYNGTVSLHGANIEANPSAKREARRYLFDAHNAARAAFGRSRAATLGWRPRYSRAPEHQHEPFLDRLVAKSQMTAVLQIT